MGSRRTRLPGHNPISPGWLICGARKCLIWPPTTIPALDESLANIRQGDMRVLSWEDDLAMITVRERYNLA